MRIIVIAAFFFSMITIFSCKPEAKPTPPKKASHLFAKYYIRSIVLTEVNFEGEPMEVQNLGKSYGVRYSFRKRGPYRGSYEYKYKGNQIGQSSHAIKMSSITDFSIKENTISKSEGATLMWQGEPLDKNQEIDLLFTDEKNKAFSLKFVGPTSKTEINLKAEKIAGLSTGSGKLMLIKKQFEKIEETNSTKISEIEFYSNQLEINVKK